MYNWHCADCRPPEERERARLAALMGRACVLLGFALFFAWVLARWIGGEA